MLTGPCVTCVSDNDTVDSTYMRLCCALSLAATYTLSLGENILLFVPFYPPPLYMSCNDGLHSVLKWQLASVVYNR